jgi:hypothetical protein
MTTSHTAQTTLYADSYGGGNTVPYYNGSSDALDTISGNEVSTAMAPSGSGVLNSGGVFDVWWEGNTYHTICVATNGSGGGWASDTGGSNTARGTGYTQLDLSTRPYITNKNAVAHCYNGTTDYGSIAVNRLTYLGTVCTDAGAAGVVSWTFGTAASGGGAARLCVWNYYNRTQTTTVVIDNGATYTYTTNAVRECRNSTTYTMTFVSGYAEDAAIATFNANTALAVNTGFLGMNLALDTTASDTQTIVTDTRGTNAFVYRSKSVLYAPLTGIHYITCVEQGDNTNANTPNLGSGNQIGLQFRM